MKITPVFSSNNLPKHIYGQKFSSTFSKQNAISGGACEDVFVRLAEASLKDKAIEHDLQSMGLI